MIREGLGGSVPARGHTTAKVDGAGGQAGSKPRKEPRRKINFLKCILSATIFRRWKTVHRAEESPSPTAGFAMGLQSGPGVTESMAKSPDYNRNHIQAGSKRRPGDSSVTTDSSRRQDINRINNNYPPPAAAVSPFSSLSGNESSLVCLSRSDAHLFFQEFYGLTRFVEQFSGKQCFINFLRFLSIFVL